MTPYRYWSRLKYADKIKLAKALGTSVLYLSHLFNSLRKNHGRKRDVKAGPKILLGIEEATRELGHGVITAKDMRPDIS